MKLIFNGTNIDLSYLSRDFLYFYNAVNNTTDFNNSKSLATTDNTKIYNFAGGNVYTKSGTNWNSSSFDKNNFGIPNFSLISNSLIGKIYYYKNGNIQEINIFPYYK